jgi:hypothetical protein
MKKARESSANQCSPGNRAGSWKKRRGEKEKRKKGAKGRINTPNHKRHRVGAYYDSPAGNKKKSTAVIGESMFARESSAKGGIRNKYPPSNPMLVN